MAESDTFCLCLNEFEKNIKAFWQELQIENDFCDVTLACEDKQIKVHKVIVAACSPVLRNILKLNLNQHPLIYLRRVKYKDLQNLLNFMYQGEVNVDEEDLHSFLEVAVDLNIKGLSEGNKESVNSIVGEPLQATHESNSKKKRTAENIRQKDFNKSNYIEPFNEIEQAYEDFSDNTNKCFISTIESQNKKIKQEKYVDNNQTIVSLLEEKKFICDKCGYKAKYKHHLKVHVESIHEGVHHPCDQCDYQATEKSSLKKHVKSIHEGVRYPCDHCDYKATTNPNLKVHVESIHERVRHSCNHCDYWATTKGHLRTHLLKYHSGQ